MRHTKTDRWSQSTQNKKADQVLIKNHFTSLVEKRLRGAGDRMLYDNPSSITLCHFEISMGLAINI